MPVLISRKIVSFETLDALILQGVSKNRSTFD